MRKIISIIVLIALVAVAATSCLEDKEVATAPECAITSFSVGSIKSTLTTKAYDGVTDSSYAVTISGSDIYFNIDQVKNVISSVDSIASWADISRVVPTVGYTGYIFCRQRGSDLFYSFTSGTDSVDFTQKVEFLVISTDGEQSKHYDAFLHKATVAHDSLYWTARAASPVGGVHHSVVLGTRLFVFAPGASDVPTVAVADTVADSLTWSAPVPVSTAIDYRSVLVYRNELYAIDTAGQLFASTDGTTWAARPAPVALTALLAADRHRLYATDGVQIIDSVAGEGWTARTLTDDVNLLPGMPVSYAAYNTNTNDSLQHVVMFGLADANTENAVAWYKLSASDSETDQPWSYIDMRSDRTYAMPRLGSVQMVRFGRRLLAVGCASAEAADGAADCIYASDDNGLTWHRQLSKLSLPAGRDAAQAFTLVVIDGRLWLLQADGKVWSGTMGK